MITPSDAATAARTFPRRWRELLVRGDDDEELLRTGSPSVLDLAGQAAARLAWVGDALEAVASAERPSVAPLGPVPPAPTRAQAALDRLGLEAHAIAERLQQVDADTWGRSVAVGDRAEHLGRLVEEGLLAVGADLRAAERAFEDAREALGR